MKNTLTRQEMTEVDRWMAAASTALHQAVETLHGYCRPRKDRRWTTKEGWVTVETWAQISPSYDWPRIDKAIAICDRAQLVLSKCDEIWRANGCWNRFFLVVNSNGHVHRERNCSTCFPTTQYNWLIDLAGADEAEMVLEYGSDACTVCFPSAPVMKGWGHSKSQKEKQAAKAEREALRAAKRAAQDAKNLNVPVSAGKCWKITTLAEAKRVLVDHLMDVRFGADHIPNKDAVAERQASIEPLVRAIAEKLNVDPAEVLAEYTEKARVKYVKDLRDSIKNVGRWKGYYSDPAEADAKLASIKAELARLTGKVVA